MKTVIAISLRGAIAASAILLLAACQAAGSRETKNAAPAPPRDPLEVTAAPALRTQIKVGEPAWGEVTASLSVPGRVEADETRVARVGSPVTGRITELEVLEGQAVVRGQLLASLHSTQLSDAQFGLLKAYSQQQLAERAASRARLLLQADVIGEAELQRREAELAQASAELSSSHDQLKVLGMSDDSIAKLQQTRAVNSTSHVVASIDGTVLERKVTIGQVVQPADTVFVVADLSNVWLVADVPEQSAGTIAVGKTVEAGIAALPGQTLRGRLSFVSAVVNPETRTVRTRMDLPNPERRYKPAMLATIVLQDHAERQLLIPATAVVREGNREQVFVEKATDTYVLREVTLGGEFGDKRVLLGGLRPHEKIVLDGAFHLNNERKHLATQGE
jgi:membrane fusion protein, heavy metal efflux system